MRRGEKEQEAEKEEAARQQVRVRIVSIVSIVGVWRRAGRLTCPLNSAR